jgi:transposase
VSNLIFLGADVSKLWIDVALDGTPNVQRFPNDAKGFVRLAKTLQLLWRDVFAVVEATGGYETALIDFLVDKGATVHRAMPYHARSFLRSLGRNAKTDAIDAVGLARYARERHAELRPYAPPSEKQARLNQLVMRREDLVRMRTAETTRVKHPRYRDADKRVLKSVQRTLAFLDAEIADVEAEIDALAAAPEFARKIEVATSIKGIGKRSAKTCLAFMSELGTLDRRAAASLAGCAPHPRDSGLKRGRRSVFGGRDAVRRALYLCAMSASRSNPVLRDFYKRLIQNGKPKMVAIVAVMRKLIVMLNAKLRDDEKAQKLIMT